MRMRPAPSIPVLLAVGLLLFSCVEDGDQVPADAVRVGLLLPFTGEDAAIGTGYERAVLMAVDIINGHGGLGGQPVALITRGTHSDPERALASAQALLDEGVIAIIGPENATVARRILPLLDAQDVPLISPVVSGSDNIVLSADYRWIRLAPSAALLGRTSANHLYDSGVRQISVVYVNEDYNFDYSAALVERFLFRGGLLSASVHIDESSLGYEDQVDELTRSAGRDVVLALPTESAARFVNELFTSGGEDWNWFLSPTLETPVFIQNTYPGVLDGARGVGVDVSQRDMAFARQFEQRFGRMPDDGAWFYYDAVALLAFAIESMAAAGDPPDGASLALAVMEAAKTAGVLVDWNELTQGLDYARDGRKVSYRGLTGPFLLDATGQQMRAPTSVWTIEDGEIVTHE